MSIHRFAARRDTNESRLVAIAEKLGGIWTYGPPLDGWLWHPRIGWAPIEIKSEKGRYTESQKRFIAKCEFSAVPCFTWRTEEDVLRLWGESEVLHRFQGRVC